MNDMSLGVCIPIPPVTPTLIDTDSEGSLTPTTVVPDVHIGPCSEVGIITDGTGDVECASVADTVIDMSSQDSDNGEPGEAGPHQDHDSTQLLPHSLLACPPLCESAPRPMGQLCSQGEQVDPLSSVDEPFFLYPCGHTLGGEEVERSRSPVYDHHRLSPITSTMAETVEETIEDTGEDVESTGHNGACRLATMDRSPQYLDIEHLHMHELCDAPGIVRRLPHTQCRIVDHVNRLLCRISGNRFYVGITENPRRRWLDGHIHDGWSQMLVVWAARTSQETAGLEKEVLARWRCHPGCANVGCGGERASQGSPHFLYIVTRDDGLIRRTPPPTRQQVTSSSRGPMRAPRMGTIMEHLGINVRDFFD